MDRWGDADDDDGFDSRVKKGRVARTGIGAFVKAKNSDAGSGQIARESTISIVPSKRVQRKMQEQKKMPPPPVTENVGKIGEGCFKTPEWVSEPALSLTWEVVKDGAKLQEIQFTKPATVVGRLASCDVILDHASISRQHAAVCFREKDGKWVLVDLGSAHGTFIDKKRLKKNVPVDLDDKCRIQFAASTRNYIVKLPDVRKRKSAGSGKSAKRARVRFADSSPSNERKLEQVIGYSDGGGFAVQVGPRSIKDGEKGLFEDALSVASTDTPAHPLTNRSGSPCPGVSSRLKEAMHVVKQSTPKSQHLYDEVPPAKDRKPVEKPKGS